MAEEEPVTPAVFQIIEGYCNETGAANAWMACGSVTLVKQGSLNILVDCGSPWDSARLVDELKRHDVHPRNVQYVVCTHGHIDHIGNLNLFTESQILLDTDFGTKPGFYGTHNYAGDRAFPISEHIDVILTPGHTHRDLSVIVRNVEDRGTIVIAGDLFESEADLENDQLWQQTSYDPKLQAQSRRLVLEMADWIVPGHGPVFQVPIEGKSVTTSSQS